MTLPRLDDPLDGRVIRSRGLSRLSSLTSLDELMDYPLKLSFKIMALAPQVRITDDNGRLLFYVKQKLFKLKEAVTVFEDAEQTRPLYSINADRVIDFSAAYHFTDRYDQSLGSVRRKGMRSLWKTHYEIVEGDRVEMTIDEENPWAQVFDSLLGEVPLLGMFTGYFLHPKYLVARVDGSEVMRLRKTPSFLESTFVIEKLGEFDEKEETRALLSLMMMVLLERSKG